MNIFYAPPNQIRGNQIELLGQEATHVSKVLRYREEDAITVVDGQGGWYEGIISRILRDSIQVTVQNFEKKPRCDPRLALALGIIKKRDRLEFAVEKAVELGASEIVLFRSEHTVKENVRMDRLESTVLSAMKQSLRAYLPPVTVVPSLSNLIDKYKDAKLLVAHEKKEGETGVPGVLKDSGELVLFVGPEGGFSEDEITLLKNRDSEIVSLGSHRLRAETAVTAFLSQFL